MNKDNGLLKNKRIAIFAGENPTGEMKEDIEAKRILLEAEQAKVEQAQVMSMMYQNMAAQQQMYGQPMMQQPMPQPIMQPQQPQPAVFEQLDIDESLTLQQFLKLVFSDSIYISGLGLYGLILADQTMII